MADCTSGERRFGFSNALNRKIYLYGTKTAEQTSNNQNVCGMYDSTKSNSLWYYRTDLSLCFDAPVQINKVIRLPEKTCIVWSTTKNSPVNDQARIYMNSSQNLIFSASAEQNYYLHLGVVDSTWSLNPDVSGNLTLGTSNHKWGQIFSTSASISTSDRNEKNNIVQISDKYVELFKLLKPVTYKFNDGNSGRTHTGFIAQDVEDAMNKVGITDLEFAAFCKDSKTKRNENDEDEIIPNEYIYGLRYEEFIALNTKMIQHLLDRVETLESRVLNN